MAQVLFIVYLMMVLSQSYSLTGFSYGDPTLPYYGDDMALWFNTTSNKITIISDPAVHLFDTTDHSFTAQAPTPTRITGYAFSKTFIGDTLYFNDYPKDNIGTYKLSTNQYTSPMSPSITTAVDWACLTSDNRYVYALGGLSTGAVDYFQVLDSSGNKWYTGSSLNAYRFMSACEIYQGTIYIFGGEYYSAGLRSIEKIFVGQNNAVLSNLATSTFQTIGATLHAPKSRMATAMCENVDQSLIYLIGGYNAYGGAEYATVELFDADTDTIVKQLSMKRARWQTSAICANGYIYVFGGYTKEGWEELNTWEVSNYLTEAPTASPTDGTVSPTKYPSQIPSVSPSKQPSASPSKAPTESTSTPSSSPSDPPSVSPTESPTSPSHAPTLVTMDPSSIPSLSPSSFPSVSPTLYPSLSPSSDPSVSPTADPSVPPSFDPSLSPTADPSVSPSSDPTTFIQSESHSTGVMDNSKASDIRSRVLMVSTITSCIAYLLL